MDNLTANRNCSLSIDALGTTWALFHQVNIFCFDGILIHFWDTITYSVSPNSVLEYVFRTKYDRISTPHLEYYSISASRSTF